MLKVVLHIDETEKWPVAIGNAINLIKDAGRENVMIEVIANVNAVRVYNEQSSLYTQLESLAESGITLIACRNSLRSLQIDDNSLPSFVTVVPAAITHIIRKHNLGYAYIKP